MSTVPRLRSPALKTGNSLKIGIISVSSQYPSASSLDAKWPDKLVKKMNKSIQTVTQTLSPMSPPLSFPSTWCISDRVEPRHLLIRHTFPEGLPPFIQHACEVLLCSKPSTSERVGEKDGYNLRTGPTDAVCYGGIRIKMSLTKAFHCSCPQTRSSVMAASAGNIESVSKQRE